MGVAAVGLWLLAVLLMAAVPALGAGGDRRATPRVVGGTTGGITAVPWQAAVLRAGLSPFDGQFCGAVVLDARHVLTAAHCVFEDDPPGTPTAPAALRVLAGTAHLRKPSEPTPAATEAIVAVAAIHVDPAYDRTGQDHDAAVLALAQPLYAGAPTADGATPIAPIALQTAAQTAASVGSGAAAVLSGWGYTADLADASSPKDPAKFPAELQLATQHLVLDAACDAAYVQPITSAMVCAGGNGDPAACNGDSGGPLATTGTGAPALVGIVSFGVPCHHVAYPDVYTRVGQSDVAAFIASARAAPIPGDPVVTTTTTTTTTTEPTTTTTTTTPVDVAGPFQQLVRMRCERRDCVLVVQVGDPLPSAGIRALETLQRWARRARCPITGPCPARVSRYLRAQALGAGRYSVRAPRLPGRTSSLLMRGIDQAGKRAYRGTVVVVPKLRGS